MRLLTALVIAACATGVMAQDLPQTVQEATRPIQLRIRHADPWAVKAMLEGQSLRFPEMSTILGIGGMLPGIGDIFNQTGSSPFFAGGKLIVNPGDNSIWFIPDRK